MGVPLCREIEFSQLFDALDFEEPLVIVSSPLSSGKMITIRAALDAIVDSSDQDYSYLL
jgi:hypothetical protein